jgi:hypothetical protein
MFLQKNLSIVDTYKWLPLDSENTQHVPITYANKHCNEIMSYKQEESRALEEYHQWERERYGKEAEFKEFEVAKKLVEGENGAKARRVRISKRNGKEI